MRARPPAHGRISYTMWTRPLLIPPCCKTRMPGTSPGTRRGRCRLGLGDLLPPAGDLHAFLLPLRSGGAYHRRGSSGARGGHLNIVELGAETGEGGLDAERHAHFAERFDATLCRLNDDYAGHRAGGYGMDPARALYSSRRIRRVDEELR